MPPFTATLVGVTDAPTDFDDSSPQMVFPRSFLGAHPDVGVVQTIIAARLAPGVDPRDVMDAVHQLPNGGDAYSAPQRIVSDSARRAVRFQVTALWVVTALSVLAAAVVIAQVVSRTLRVSDEERDVHGGPRLAPPRPRGRARHRGRHRRHRRPCRSPDSSRTPSPRCSRSAFCGRSNRIAGAHVDWLVTVAGLVALGGLVVGTAAVVGMRRTRPARARSRPGALTSSRFARGAGMPLSVGARFASSGARGRPWGSLLAGAIGVAGRGGSPLRRPQPHAHRRPAGPLGRQLRRAVRKPLHADRRRHRRSDPRQPRRRRRHGRRHRLGQRRRRRHADAGVHQREGRPRPDRAPWPQSREPGRDRARSGGRPPPRRRRRRHGRGGRRLRCIAPAHRGRPRRDARQRRRRRGDDVRDVSGAEPVGHAEHRLRRLPPGRVGPHEGRAGRRPTSARPTP